MDDEDGGQFQEAVPEDALPDLLRKLISNQSVQHKRQNKFEKEIRTIVKDQIATLTETVNQSSQRSPPEVATDEEFQEKMNGALDACAKVIPELSSLVRSYISLRVRSFSFPRVVVVSLTLLAIACTFHALTTRIGSPGVREERCYGGEHLERPAPVDAHLAFQA